MKLTIYVTFIFLTVIVGYSYSQPNQEWVSRYSFLSNSFEVGEKIVLDKSQNSYIIGSSRGHATDYDFVTIKYLHSGNIEWINRYNGEGNGDDIINDITFDTEGSIYVTGGSLFNQTRKDFITIKYNSSGNQQWIARYTGAGLQNFPTAIATDYFDNIIITGKDSGKFVIIKYNKNGIEQWISSYPAPFPNDIPWALNVDISGNVYVSGEKSGDCITIKYDSTGVLQWVNTYGGISNEQDFGNSIAVDNFGNTYVSGSSVEDSNLYGGYLLIKYNPSGVRQWIRFYEGTGGFIDVPKAMAIDKLGNVYVTGYTTEAGQGYNYTTIKYNGNGDTLWKASYHNGPNDIAVAIELDGSGNIYITGESDGNGTSNDYSTIKYDTAGNQKWAIRYDYSGLTGDFATSVAADNIGNVYVTGGSDGDMLTIKYSQITGISTQLSNLPQNFILHQNYPNPFNPMTKILFDCPSAGSVRLNVYNVRGIKVSTLVDDWKNAGIYSIDFDGSELPSGVYYYELEVNGMTINTKRMLLLK